jgi:hypothetical protein
MRRAATGYPKDLKTPCLEIQVYSQAATQSRVAFKCSSQAVVVDTLGALVVVVWASHVTLALTLVYYENDLRSDLSTEESRLFKSNLLPLGKVLGSLDTLDVRG